jgi:hypothetical protein
VGQKPIETHVGAGGYLTGAVLGMDPEDLQAARLEGTPVLPLVQPSEGE